MKKEKKAALITGGARRIGRVLCLALAEKGYDIALHYRHSRMDAENTAKDIRDRGVQCQLFQCDLADFKILENLIPDVFQYFPHCKLLVNNASVFKRGSFHGTDLDMVEMHLSVNFKAPYLLTQTFAKVCQSGMVVNILDTKITKSSEVFFAYKLSKKLLFEFTFMAAKVLGPNIRVNGICPGIILPSTETSDEILKKLINKLPLAQKGDPKHVAKALLYLIDNEYVTGECLFVDGGEHL